MRKRDELTDPNSCLNRAGPDELIFVLRGHDIAAPDIVRGWVAWRIGAGKNKPSDPQIIEALEWANRVEKFGPFGEPDTLPENA